ncbi:MAG TPA: sulfite exporter TauE/SafE family protein [Candidatus Saccharimonadales bacterium]|nr:sulfite exporter TauE/SafE family protein [Candidatus Saccharimonadales bacterium]
MSVDITHMVISFLAGIAAGFMAAVTGGAGILSIPVLIFLGLTANSAIATNALATMGVIVSSLPKYYRAKKVRLATGLKLTPLAIIGGLIGAKALVRTDAGALETVVGILLFMMIPIILLNPEKGLKVVKENKDTVAFGYLIYFVIMVYGGFLGAGAGAFAMYALIFFFGMTYLQAKATISVPGLFLTITTFLVFLSHGLVDFKLGIPMTIGTFIGGAWGAQAALEKGDKWVRLLFVIVVILSAVKLLFFR